MSEMIFRSGQSLPMGEAGTEHSGAANPRVARGPELVLPQKLNWNNLAGEQCPKNRIATLQEQAQAHENELDCERCGIAGA